MFKRKVIQKKVSNTIEIMDMPQLEMLISGVAKTGQMDFGLRWDYFTAQEDDERVFALAIALIHEMGGRIVSDDENVMEFIRKVVNNQVNKKYYKEEK